MLRPASRLATRASLLRPITRTSPPARRFLGTAPVSQKSRSWRNKAVRLGLAGAVVYYYNTTDIFAEEPGLAHLQPPTDPELPLPTLEALAEQKAQSRARAAAQQQQADVSANSESQPAPSTSESTPIQDLESEADQQGAFNPETGEINWDCPCLGGMADGPCGPQFKEAFSCFVYSTEEPKGMDCIDKFKNMQDCFRQYPDIYGAELEDDLEEQSRELDQRDSDPEVEARTPRDGNTETSTSSKKVDLDETVPDSKVPASKDDPEIETSSPRPAYTHGDKVAATHASGPSSDAKVNERRRVAEDATKARDTESSKTEAKDKKSQEQTPVSESLVPKAAHDGR